MRKEIPEIWCVVINEEIQLKSVGVGRNFSAKRYLGAKHSRLEWKRAYNNGARLVRLAVSRWPDNEA